MHLMPSAWRRTADVDPPYADYRRAAEGSQRLTGWPWFAKRLGDLTLGSILLVVLSPVMATVAGAIKLDSAGPVLFRHRRVGGRRIVETDGSVVWEASTFEILKFRSMYTDTDDDAHRQYIQAFIEGTTAADQGSSDTYKLEADPRVTRVGHWIRKTSLDELPQLINVIKGDMSLVGPRPVPTYEVDEYTEAQMERLHAIPGMTGLWQVRGRGKVSFEEMVRMDIWYTRNRTMWLDFKLLASTLPAVLSMRGAE
jgi:lipopolysaccharide/colanic/teichoic acid biosynthesis glycosyltransferase